MAPSDRDESPASDASGTTHWRLIVHLQDGTQRRSVSLDYADRATLNAQVAHLHRNAHDVFQLFEFRNERGEMLAILARAYLGHEIVAQT